MTWHVSLNLKSDASEAKRRTKTANYIQIGTYINDLFLMFNQNNAHAVTALIMFCKRMCCNICTSISVTQLDKTWHICLLLQDIHINCLQGVLKVYLRCLKTVRQSDHFPLDSQRINCFFCLVCHPGVSFLEGKEDITEDWREKFLNTYKVRWSRGRLSQQGLQVPVATEM